MPDIASAAALLHTALEDLRAGKGDQAQRLPTVAACASDPALRAILSAEGERTARQQTRLAAAMAGAREPANLWIGGILDDAERDTRQTQPGRLLDVALIGAVRKAKAAEIVSSETAMALADQLALAELGELVAANRSEEIETDRQLKHRLAALTAGVRQNSAGE